MRTVEFGNAALGMDVLSEETSLERATMRDISNFDVHDSGSTRTRAGAVRVGNVVGAHSLWSPCSRTHGLFAQHTQLRRLDDVGGDLQVRTLLDGLRPSLRVSFYEHAGETYFTNGSDLGVVRVDGTAKFIGVTDPINAPVATPAVGGMHPGRYGVAFSYVAADGEESALSPATFVGAPEGGVSIEVGAPADAARVRLYATAVNGDILYQVRDALAGPTQALVQTNERGKQATTQFTARMPGGSDISVYNGHLLVSQGSTLRYSHPFRYGLTNPATDYVAFGSPILFHESVVDGVYVGTQDATYFLDGPTPKEFKQRRVGPAPVASDSMVMPASMLNDEVSNGLETDVVVWLSENGFALGFDGGTVRAVQSSRMALAKHGVGSITSLTQKGIKQVISVVEKTLVSDGSARDSSVST